ncbi:cadherin-like beta sandwich domain-containing protein, partial [bacterium]|nr:cadherin-like beta sandwich domain-containing protein [bacterium]
MKNILKLFLAFIISFVTFSSVKAASISISSSVSSATVGSSVIITVRGNDLAGKFSLTSSNGSVLSGGANSFWMENGSVSYTFKANSAGTATVMLSSLDAADFNGNPFSGSKSVVVTVKNKQVIVLSSDSSLSSLGVENATLSPEFTSGNKEYSVSLEPDTTSINVLATTNHGGASVSGAGTREVTDGDNRIEIVVTAENGTTSTYVINANVKEYDPIEVKVKDQSYTVVRKKASLTPPNNYQETTIKINDTDVPAFHSDITGYTLVALKDNEGNQNYYIYENNEYSLYKEYNFHGIILYPEELKGKDRRGKGCKVCIPSIAELFSA